MHANTVIAQAGTMREWADQWTREALAGDAAGYDEVAFLLRRAAAQAERAVGLPVETDVAQRTEMPLGSYDRSDIRDG